MASPFGSRSRSMCDCSDNRKIKTLSIDRLGMKRPLRVAAGFSLAVIFFSSCDRELSDMEVTDPSVLQPYFAVEHSILADGSEVNKITASIIDRNLKNITIKNGYVTVNGQQMSILHTQNLSTYHIPTATVDLNTNYTFEIVLPDGQRYSGDVTSQEKAFTSVAVPVAASPNNDLRVSWQDVYIHDQMMITVNVTSPLGTVVGGRYELTTAEMSSGTFVIPKTAFQSPPGATSAMITIMGVKYGTIDPKFRPGSATVSRMRIEKRVTF